MDDWIGRRFGRLTVISTLRRNGKLWFRCQCDCSGICESRKEYIVKKKTRSCGCLQRETTARRNTTHGGVGDDIYTIWRGMKQRCLDPNSSHYKYYGGRGIKIDERWDSFAVFREDMGPRPSKKHSLDRIDVNGNYEPKNCRWATAEQQRTNRPPQDCGRSLTRSKVKEIKELLAKMHNVYGVQALIAKQFGVSPKTISKISLGLRWRD